MIYAFFLFAVLIGAFALAAARGKVDASMQPPPPSILGALRKSKRGAARSEGKRRA